jgi:hypothetical protein
MTARRRRGTSESEQVPLLISPGSRQNQWSAQDIAASSSHQNPNNNGLPGSQSNFSVNNGLPKDTSSAFIPDPTMTSRDRTKEFATTVRSLQGREVARVATARDPRKMQHLQRYGEFMLIAK